MGNGTRTYFSIRRDLVPVAVPVEERVPHDILRPSPVACEQQREPHQPERVLRVQILDPGCVVALMPL